MVEITIDLADRTLTAQGHVMDVSAGSNELTGSFPVRVTWENEYETQVKPGMTATVSIETDDAREGIVIPYDRIIERDGSKWVFLGVDKEDNSTPADKNGIIVARKITLGTRLGNRIMIEEGLKEGDILITSGFSSIAPGYSIEVTLLGDTGKWQ